MRTSIILQGRNLLWLCSLAVMGTGQTKKSPALSCSFWSTLWEFSSGFSRWHRIRGYVDEFSISKDFSTFLRASEGCKRPQPWESTLAMHSTGKKKSAAVPAVTLPRARPAMEPKLMLLKDFQEAASITQDETSWGFGFAQSWRFHRGGVSAAVRAPNGLMATRKQE